MSHADFWRDRVLGRGNCQCSGGDVGRAWVGYSLTGRGEEGGEMEVKPSFVGHGGGEFWIVH